MTAIIAASAQAGAIAAAVPGAVILAPVAALPAEPVAVWLEGLTDLEIEALSSALTSRGRIDIAVSSARIDGFTDPPLVPKCRGLIAGFGHAGIAAALRLINQA